MNLINFCAEMFKFTYCVSKTKITGKRYITNYYKGIRILEPFESQELIAEAINRDSPLMIGRMGSGEVSCINQYLRQKYHISKDYTNNMYRTMINNVGCFPTKREVLDTFAKVYLDSIPHVDISGIFSYGDIEGYLLNHLAHKKVYTRLISLDPLVNNNPWTKALENKKVLVIYPLSETIKVQYEKRHLIHKDNNILPEFKKLSTMKTIQSLGGNDDFKDWNHALQFMYNEIPKYDFDIALIGAGGYGYPLAAFVKKMGKKAIHLGGITQMMFGIKGKRWVEDTKYKDCFNEHWVYPLESDRPENFKKVENGCYW
jgi:hypothetical protein